MAEDQNQRLIGMKFKDESGRGGRVVPSISGLAPGYVTVEWLNTGRRTNETLGYVLSALNADDDCLHAAGSLAASAQRLLSAATGVAQELMSRKYDELDADVVKRFAQDIANRAAEIENFKEMLRDDPGEPAPGPRKG